MLHLLSTIKFVLRSSLKMVTLFYFPQYYIHRKCRVLQGLVYFICTKNSNVKNFHQFMSSHCLCIKFQKGFRGCHIILWHEMKKNIRLYHVLQSLYSNKIFIYNKATEATGALEQQTHMQRHSQLLKNNEEQQLLFLFLSVLIIDDIVQ